MPKSYKATGVPFPRSISRAHQSSCYCYIFKNSSSSSFCYILASHACNLGSHTTFFLSFDSFQVTIQHATIVVHENCWDNFKSSPRFLHFYVILMSHVSHHKNFPCHAGYEWHKCQNFSDLR